MTTIVSHARKAWYLFRKDLRRECRSRTTWPSMLLLGFLLVITLELQLDLPSAMRDRVAGGLLWLAVFVAGTLGLERSFGNEQDHGCWDALRMYPVAPAVVFLSKALFNFATLTGFAAVLIPLFAVLSGAPLLKWPGATLLIVLLANLGLAAIGTLVGALTSAARNRGHLIALLLLPLVLPVVLGAGEATRLVIAGEWGGEGWRWLQLLGAFAAMFITAGVLFFEFIMED